jgi:hypothetical protein
MTDTLKPLNGRFRLRSGLIIAVFGYILFLFGAEPALFRVDRSPMTGYLQILTFLIGLAILCIGGYVSISSLWNGYQKTIASDIGLRLVGTGYVVAVACALADVLGFGTQRQPFLPFFGPWQEAGVMAGCLVIALGFGLMLPFRGARKHPGE